MIPMLEPSWLNQAAIKRLANLQFLGVGEGFGEGFLLDKEVLLTGAITCDTTFWWFRNPAGIHQLRLVIYPIIYRVLYIPGGAGFLPSTVLLLLYVIVAFLFQ